MMDTQYTIEGIHETQWFDVPPEVDYGLNDMTAAEVVGRENDNAAGELLQPGGTICVKLRAKSGDAYIAFNVTAETDIVYYATARDIAS